MTLNVISLDASNYRRGGARSANSTFSRTGSDWPVSGFPVIGNTVIKLALVSTVLLSCIYGALLAFASAFKVLG